MANFGKSFSELTNKEYNEVVKHQKRVLAYVKIFSNQEDQLKDFIKNDLSFKYHKFKNARALRNAFRSRGKLMNSCTSGILKYHTTSSLEIAG